ncbi:MAG: EamA family transporter [Coriobacteriia bacterium]|nr:EamA family transporter [Coriobacteriia bacterium]MBN2841383.1 EamA family transporter [Coriobacteriia bacterium]
MSARDRSSDTGKRAEGYALVLVAAFCWAGGGLLAKWLFSMPGPETAGWPFPPLGIEVDPIVLSAARAAVSTVIAFAYLSTRRRQALRIRGRDIPFLMVFGVLGLAMVHFAYFKTISLTGVATAILLEYLAPVIVLVFSVTLLGERLTLALPAAVTLSVAGCALMVGALGPKGLVVPPEGLFWGLASAVFFAGYSLMGKYAATRFRPWTLLTYGLGFAAVFWLIVLGGPGPILSLLSDHRAALAVLALAVVSTIIPFGAFLKALSMIEATQASVTSTIEPVIAGIVAWFVFGEHLTPLQLLGGVLVVVAVMLSQASTRVPAEMPVVDTEALGGDASGV